MATRNFEFRVSPTGGQRGGRFVADPSGDAIVIGAPVVTTGDVDSLGRQVVELATGAQDKPVAGAGGIAVYEEVVYAGVDPWLTTYSDMGTAPAGSAVQVVGGSEVKVAFTNTTDSGFLTREDYPHARVMVAGLGATPTLEVGDFLTPGTGDDTDGYWAETSDAAEAWLVVTYVDSDLDVVEARVNF